MAFDSLAENLVPDDTNQLGDVFVRDRKTGVTERISLASDGRQANGHSSDPVVSGDGRFIAFQSEATNLVANASNGMTEVFVRDRAERRTERVSAGSGGVQGNATSSNPTINADGRFVAFQSRASNLVDGGTNAASHVFVRDLADGITERVSVSSDGTEANGDSGAPSISADGRHVAFYSWATNLAPLDSNDFPDIFVHDRLTHTTERVSVGPGGQKADAFSGQPVLNAEGRFVAFMSHARNLVARPANENGAVFVHDRVTGVTELVSAGIGGVAADDYSASPALSADGRYVAFQSRASNLVENKTNPGGDVFVYDRDTHHTVRVSVGADGQQSNGFVLRAALSANGGVVAFGGAADTLVPDKTHKLADIFVVQRRSYRTIKWMHARGILAWTGPRATGGLR